MGCSNDNATKVKENKKKDDVKEFEIVDDEYNKKEEINNEDTLNLEKNS